MDNRIRVWGRNMTTVVLVERPIRMPTAAGIARFVDRGRGKRNTTIRSKHLFDQVEHLPVRQIGRQGLIKINETADMADPIRGIWITVFLRDGLYMLTHPCNTVLRYDPFQDAPAVYLHA